METLQSQQKSFTVDDKYESFLELIKEEDSDSDDEMVHTSDEEYSDEMITDDEIDWATSDVEFENCDIVENLETGCIPPSSNSSVQVSNNENSFKGNRKLLGLKSSSKERSKQSSCARQVEEKPVFECGVCWKRFEGRYELCMHMREHTGEGSYACQTCDKAFREKRTLEHHQCPNQNDSDKKDVIFKCSICGEKYPDSNKFRHHINRHKGIRCTCSICKGTYAHPQTFKVHMKLHKSADGKRKSHLSCDICKKLFVSKDNLRTHMKSHADTVTFVCDVCHLSFGRYWELKNHVLIHTGEKCYPCSLCPRAYRQRSGRRRHMAWHRGDHTCKYCQKKYSRNHDLLRHVSKHEKEQQIQNGNSLQCKYCCKFMLCEMSLKEHIEGHKRIEQKLEHLEDQQTCMCKRCGKHFSETWNLNRHIREVHKKDIDTYREMDSDSVEDRPQKMDNVKDNHSTLTTGDNDTMENNALPKERQESFCCNVCCKKFSSKKNLMCHMKNSHHIFTHQYDSNSSSDLKKFQCDLCSKRLKTKRTLREHMEHVHLQIYKYPCRHCGEKFYNMKYLRRHIQKNHVT